MEDKLLIDGLFARDERSVARLEEKDSGYCYTVAYAVVRCREDAQECVGDAMLGAWNSIPPNRPENLGAYVGRSEKLGAEYAQSPPLHKARRKECCPCSR